MPQYRHPGVYTQESASAPPPIQAASTATAGFVGAALRGRPFWPRLVTSRADFERTFGPLDPSCDLPLSASHFFLGGGARAYIVRTIDPLGSATAAAGDNQAQPRLLARGPGAWGNVAVTLSQNADFPDRIDIRVDTPEEVERFEALSLRAEQDRFYADILFRDSDHITVAPTDSGAYLTFGAVGALLPDGEAVVMALTGGDDGDPALAIGAASLQRALRALDPHSDISILAFPGVNQRALAQLGSDYAAQRATMMFLIDPPGDAHDTDPDGLLQAAQRFRDDYSPKSTHSALYFPWVEIADPYSQAPGATRFAPPSGFIAGLYARTDSTAGVWKAPAGTEAVLPGAVGLAVDITDRQQDTLSPLGINAIRRFPSAGIVCWGARTMAPQSPDYRHVPIQRLSMFLRQSIDAGTRWAAFEPNAAPLWAALRDSVEAFMLSQFQRGALQGRTPSEAFFVLCDQTNNVQATIDAGQVHITVGFAPMKPAEFVILSIVQRSQDT